MSKLKFFLYVFLLSALSGFAQTRNAKNAIVSEEIIFPYQNEHVHGSSIVSLPNGDMLACWFQGSGERTADDVRVMGARLKKGSKTWTTPFLMADTKGIPDCNPVLFLNRKGKLFLFWVAVHANKWEDAILRFRTSTNYKDNDAPVWEWQDDILLKPNDSFAKEVEKRFKELPDNEAGWAAYAPQYDDMIKEASKDLLKRSLGWMTRIHPITLESGRILLPLYSDGLNFSMVAISDDDGTTWRPSLPIVGRGPIQPALAVKKNGDIVAYMRDSGDAPARVHTSISTDNGESWSASQKTEIPNEASVEICVLKDGIWAFFGNDISDGRYRLSLYLSDDEGTSWRWKELIEYMPDKRGSFSYPCLIQTPDGLLNISYSYSLGEGKKSIKHVVVDPEKIATKTNAEKLGFAKDKKVILLHIDDAGMCPEANKATQFYFENNYIQSAAVMMPCPNSGEMIEWAKKNPKADIGAHLTLTSEWQKYRWGSITKASKVPGLIDPDGKFYHEVPEVVAHASAKEVEIEIQAQLDKMIALGVTPSHMDTHMGTLYGSPDYVKVFLATAEKYQIPANAIDLSNPTVANLFKSQGYPITDGVVDLMNAYKLPKLDFFTSVPNGKTYEEKRNNFFELVKSLPNALTEIIFHPSVETENLKSITGSWQQRVWESQLFSDPVVIKFFKDNEIQITNWEEIMQKFKAKKQAK
ncbi:MAG: exo-alpha-sialidase [Prolixibacteraceae bacterium]|nr:exo-alpha-sialidase [Prolixibacteraceae bacterium]